MELVSSKFISSDRPMLPSLQPLLIWVCLAKTSCRKRIFSYTIHVPNIILPPVGIPFGYLTFQKSSRKNFLTFHEYTCNDTVTNMIVIIEICVKNKLSTYPEWVKGLRLLFMFSQILTNFNFSFVSNFFPIYADTLEESHWTGCLPLGRVILSNT